MPFLKGYFSHDMAQSLVSASHSRRLPFSAVRRRQDPSVADHGAATPNEEWRSRVVAVGQACLPRVFVDLGHGTANNFQSVGVPDAANWKDWHIRSCLKEAFCI